MDIWTLGPPGQVQDHQDHHQDDQEQLLDNFKEGFKRFKGGLRGLRGQQHQFKSQKQKKRTSWTNFKRLVSETVEGYRHEAKTHRSVSSWSVF